MMAGDVSFEERRPYLLEAARGYLEHHRNLCHEMHNSGGSGCDVVACITAMADALILNLYQCAAADFPTTGKACSAVLAIGGYGRAELNPLSDIDVMFYCSDQNKDLAEKIAERILYLLWDLNLDVGYSVRTSADCLTMAQQDITIRTAMLDTRFLAGDEVLFHEFERQVLPVLLGRNSQQFLKAKYEEHETRLAKYGSSVYMLEPNIKEGEGGLRDLHTAVWMARVKYKAKGLRDLLKKGVISEREMREIEAAYDYLWRIRNELHFQSKRKTDQIQYDKQEQIATFLGYKNNKQALSVEQFMQDYYAQATRTEHIASSLIFNVFKDKDTSTGILGYLGRRKLGDDFFSYRGELKTARKSLFPSRPEAMMQAFLLAKQNNLALSADVKGQIRDNLTLVNDGFRRNREISTMFLEILRGPTGVAKSLHDMHHLGFLNKYIPEFKRISCKVQHDAYHVYTVDIHSIFAVAEIEKLWSGAYREAKPLLTKVAADIGKPELIVLAVLFHDIGKGEGKDHSNKGADMMPKIARRLNLSKESSKRLEFLVRHHLDMAHISQRRDLNDIRLIQDFANTMEMVETLKMLYMLTFADLKAVGPDVWSQWKGHLLQDLYEKTYETLERGNFISGLRSERVRNRKRKVLAALQDDFGEKRVKSRLRSMSLRYLLTHRSWEIKDHVALELSRGNETVAMQVTHDVDAECTVVTISALDVPGLFSMIAGVMAANGINILGAQIYTRSNGFALDVLHVNKPIGGVIDDPAKWKKVKDNLTSVLEGRVKVSSLVKKRQKSSSLLDQKIPRFPNKVEFDCDVSREHTVIDIFAHDKVGLLYRITRTLAELGLYIHVAKISTKVDQAADTFYVKDIFGHTISDEAKREHICKALLECMEE
ncbi:MAG: [protein-PII] uridylyltransferase [Desulfuromonadales bacterium]|nr:[protein-PII] uridylyltransferase [Desulfuromonadales bacterium]